MTYQFITLEMVDNAKVNGGFIDQTSFKTESKYAFDTLILSEDVLQILDSYINIIRPKMIPKCNYLLLTTSGNQYTALGSAMSILVHQAIEKYVNPMRYRQIIESESAERLTPDEMMQCLKIKSIAPMLPGGFTKKSCHEMWQFRENPA